MLQGIPRLVTGKNIFTSPSGAVFEAELISRGAGTIIDHGFQWREVGKFEIDFVSLGPLDQERFQKEVNHGFQESKQYEVRAFTRTSSQKAYGMWIKFRGAGSLGPMITAINPKQGTWGDTLTVNGNHFSYNRELIKVEFGEVTGELVSTTDNQIKVIVPAGFIKTSTTTIRVKAADKFVNSSDQFSLFASQVLQVTPAKGGSGTLVTVRGKYFNTLSCSVKFGGITIPINRIFKDSLTLNLPKEIPPGVKDVTVLSGPFEATLPKAFTRNSPNLLEIIPDTGFYGDTVILRGENFGSKFPDNLVSIYGETTTIIDVKENELKVVIPVVSRPTLKFSITADNVTSESGKTFKIVNPRITDLLPDRPLYPGQLLTIKGENFYPSIYNYPYSYKVKINSKDAHVVSASYLQLQVELPLLSVNMSPVNVIHFDTITVSSVESIVTPVTWSSSVPGDQGARAVSFSIGNKSYILSGMLMSTVLGNEVYEYNSLNKSWRKVKSFPGQARYGATAFTINNKGYVLGGYGSSGLALRDLWEYDPVIDTWTKKKDYLFHPVEAFNLNGEIFCISDITYITIPPSTEISGFGYNTEFWKYDPVSDSWIVKATPPYTLRRDAYYDYFTMQVGGVLTTGYLSSEGYLYNQYNVHNDEWLSMGLVNLDANSPITFDYGGNGYLLGNKKLYKYNPALNQWSLLESNLSNVMWQGGQPIKFRVNNSWYFALFSYNQYYLEPHIAYKNMLLELNCNLAGF